MDRGDDHVARIGGNQPSPRGDGGKQASAIPGCILLAIGLGLVLLLAAGWLL